MESFEYKSPYSFLVHAPFLLYAMLLVPLSLAALFGFGLFYQMDSISRVVMIFALGFSVYFLWKGVLFVRVAKDVALIVSYDGASISLSTAQKGLRGSTTEFSCQSYVADGCLPVNLFPKGTNVLEVTVGNSVVLVSSNCPVQDKLIVALSK